MAGTARDGRVRMKSHAPELRGLCAPLFATAFKRHAETLVGEANTYVEGLGYAGKKDFVTYRIVSAKGTRPVRSHWDGALVEIAGFVSSWVEVTDLWVACTLARAWLEDPSRLGRQHPDSVASTRYSGRFTEKIVDRIILIACREAGISADEVAAVMKRVGEHLHSDGRRAPRTGPLRDLDAARLDGILAGLPGSFRAVASLNQLHNLLEEDTEAAIRGDKPFSPTKAIDNALTDKTGRFGVPQDTRNRALWLAVLDAFFEGIDVPADLLRIFPNEPVLMPAERTGTAVAAAAQGWRTAFVEALLYQPRLAYLAAAMPPLEPVLMNALHVSPAVSDVRVRDLESDALAGLRDVVGTRKAAIDACFDQALEHLETYLLTSKEECRVQLRLIRDVCLNQAEASELGTAPWNVRATALALLGEVIEERDV